EPEVHQDGPVTGSDEDVGGLDVAVEQAAGVDEGEAVADLRERLAEGGEAERLVLLDLLLFAEQGVDAGLEREPARPGRGEQRAGVGLGEEDVEVDALGRVRFRPRLERLLGGDRQPFAQRQAVDEFHREPGDGVLLAGIEDADDVGMVQVAEGAELALQAAGRGRVGARREHLQGDGDAGPGVERAEDRAQAAAADLALESKWTEPTSHRSNSSPAGGLCRNVRLQVYDGKMENQKPGPGPGSYSVAGTGTPTGAEQILFDHEKLEVYVVAREFLEMTYPFLRRKMSRSLREQFERASLSIVANIAEGAGKTSRADKQRLYEIGRGSTTETAALLDAM